jgi:hypothetical protein
VARVASCQNQQTEGPKSLGNTAQNAAATKQKRSNKDGTTKKTTKRQSASDQIAQFRSKMFIDHRAGAINTPRFQR